MDYPDRPPDPGGDPPAPAPTGRRGRVLTIGLVIVGLIAVAVGAFLVFAPDDTESDERDSSDGDRRASVFDLSEGDCWNNVPNGREEAETVHPVRCSDPHEGEVFAVVALDLGEAWPGVDVVTSQAEADCVQRFQAFVGVTYDRSVLDLYYFGPTEETWTERDARAVVCVVVDPTAPDDGRVTGSLQGAAR